MIAAPSTTVVVDPHEEVAPGLFRIEEWLGFAAEPETPDEDAVVEAGVRAAGDLGVALVESARRAPALYGPDGRSELVSLVPLPVDLRAPLAAIHRAGKVTHLAEPPAGTHRTIDLLNRSVRLAGSEDVRVLAAIIGSGQDAITLNIAQYRSYGRFVRAVLLDPLDRFVAMPPAADPERSAGPEVGL